MCIRDRDRTIMQAQFLLSIAAQPGITQRELYDHIESNDSVASRTIAILSDIGNRNTEPLHLIEVRLNPKGEGSAADTSVS